MDRRAFGWVVTILVSVAILFSYGDKTFAAEGVGTRIEEEEQARILNATVQIRLFAPAASKGQYVMAQGLGSWILNEDQIQIVTHNHWGEMLTNIEFVRFHDANNQMLLEINGAEFNKLILAKDAGTMLLMAPREIYDRPQNIHFANLGSSAGLINGGRVLLVHQKDSETGSLVVSEAVLDDSTTYKQLPAFKLHTLDGQPIVSGDSGGGVWLKGKLVANMWGRETVQQRVRQDFESWFKPGLTMNEVCYVAKLPFDLIAGDS